MINKAVVSFVSQSYHVFLKVNGYESKYVKTSHGKMHYYDAKGEGSLPPMVFLHGLGSQASELVEVFHRLRPFVKRIIALDFPAHGFSELPTDILPIQGVISNVNEALDRILEKECPVILFGNSLGGWQALRYVNHNPKNIYSMVLVSPGGAQVDPDELARMNEAFFVHSIHHPDRFISMLFNEPPKFHAMIMKIVQSRFSQPYMQALMKQLSENEESRVKPEELSNIQVPSLIIWGKKDRVLTPAQLEYFKAHMPEHFQLMEPPHFTHSPFVEENMADELVEMVLNWARRYRLRTVTK